MLSPKDGGPVADVCLILEGTYPYVTGGVSSWTHELLASQSDLTFHLVCLLPRSASLVRRYTLPGNVLSLSNVFIQEVRAGAAPSRRWDTLLDALEGPLSRVHSGGGLADLTEVIEALRPHRHMVGRRVLLNSPAAWKMLERTYRRDFPASSFLDCFWSWRALLGGLYSVLLADVPPARVYHTVSTGYAGLFAARAGVETGRPAILTEHGIYTNERRIEMAQADWLHDGPGEGLHVDGRRRTLKNFWVDTFTSYSRACYEAAEEIITLYAGNHEFQIRDGAPPEKLRIIPNGIDLDRYAAISAAPEPRRHTAALVGRVVSIKDVKTFIRAAAILRASVPDVEALIIGPTGEEPEYYEECRRLVAHLDLEETVTFTGRVRMDEYLGRIDVVVLTSISEAQPLVILEAGAAGIPVVATDVGACREMILGRADETPALGAGGAVTPLGNPSATAQELARLFSDPDRRRRSGRALSERVRVHYNKTVVEGAYRAIYEQHRRTERAWPASALNFAS